MDALPALFEKAVAEHRAGRLDTAAAVYERILTIDPNQPDATHLLGVVRARDPQQAASGIGLIQKAISLRPNVAAYHESLGIALASTGDYSSAISAYYVALGMDSNPPETWFNLANALRASGRFDESIAAYDRAIAARPEFLAALNNRAMALHESDRFDEAIAAFEQAIRSFPNSSELWKNLGNSLHSTGQLNDAIDAYQRAGSDPRAAGNALYISHYLPGQTASSLLESHRRWHDTYVAPLASSVRQHSNDHATNRTLRVGWVSPDFNGHPVGRFILPLMAQHDRSNFHFTCFSDTMLIDEVSRELHDAADNWRSTQHLNDEQLAALIRQDQIDILIDLTMHTRGTRLLAFARKPAPVQATYLAYVGTTGLPAIDYRFTDRFLDPSSDAIPWVERPVQLRSFWCYRPPPDAGRVAPLPRDSSDAITFGCLNAFSKINDKVCDLWTTILNAVPNSRLLMHAPRGKSRDRMHARFGSRVEFVGRIARAAYFALHGRIDIALDPFPYPGGTTTCDALWMGVPVVSLAAGQIPMARAGASILNNSNLAELVAYSELDYAKLAITLANDRDRLRELRSTLRERIRVSPLMDEVGFTRDFENCLRLMWKTWCDAAAS